MMGRDFIAERGNSAAQLRNTLDYLLAMYTIPYISCMYVDGRVGAGGLCPLATLAIPPQWTTEMPYNGFDQNDHNDQKPSGLRREARAGGDEGTPPVRPQPHPLLSAPSRLYICQVRSGGRAVTFIHMWGVSEKDERTVPIHAFEEVHCPSAHSYANGFHLMN